MKIVSPSAKIIEDELSQISVYQRIDACASVCYQRPPKPTEEEAQEFCRGMLKRGHLATLEMAVVHFVVDWEQFDRAKIATSPYIKCTTGESPYAYVISGSIRAIMEATGYVVEDIRSWLGQSLPVFFEPGERKYTTFPIFFADPHEIPWQHKHVAVKFIVNRAVSHELVRHRPCSFLQESQRYCRYEDEVVFIRPEWFDKSKQSTSGSAEYDWEAHMNACECRYKEFLYRKFSPQQARAVLPNSTKTELIVYCSLPQWKHIFSLRDSKAADPEMKRIMAPLHQEFREKYPESFDGQHR